MVSVCHTWRPDGRAAGPVRAAVAQGQETGPDSDTDPATTDINRLKRHRAVTTRYGRLAVRDEETVRIAAINEWL